MKQIIIKVTKKFGVLLFILLLLFPDIGQARMLVVTILTMGLQLILDHFLEILGLLATYWTLRYRHLEYTIKKAAHQEKHEEQQETIKDNKP